MDACLNVLVIGSGGREHALVWAIANSPSVDRVFAAPGNPGTALMGGAVANVSINAGRSDFGEIARFCRESDIGLVVVGPENPMADGISDFLRKAGIGVFGPGKEGAKLEYSKGFGMEFMRRHGIPHPEYAAFSDCEAATAHVASTPGPWVIKADGLALGKGVTITSDRDEALEAVRAYMNEGMHGAAGRRVVFQEFLTGREVTAMALTDGDAMIALPLARDHKRVSDGDRGPMTGGMGAFSPVDLSCEAEGTERRIREEILERTLAGLKADGTDYRGVLYAGLMLTESGPKVLEYNARFGDPETQCVLPRLAGDFAQALLACATGRLRRYLEGSEPSCSRLSVREEACATVVLASGGYPGSYRKGVPIRGLDVIAEDYRDVVVFHAGTRFDGSDLVTSGGRVLGVTALAPSLQEALSSAYSAASSVKFEGAFYRKDIGK